MIKPWIKNPSNYRGKCVNCSKIIRTGCKRCLCCANETHYIPKEKRFWKFVKKTNTCWIWTGAHCIAGYGTQSERGINYMTHRQSWIMKYGPIPKGRWILHKCDNPPCVRPSHLWLGTHAENMKDASLKKRMRGPSKLIDSQVKKIRSIYEHGNYSQKYLAKKFDTCRSNISLIVTRKTWDRIK